MRFRHLFVLAFWSFASAAFADTISYHLVMNTSSLEGNSAYIEMQGDGGGAVSGNGVIAYNTTGIMTISNFSTDGVLAAEDPYTTVNPYGGTDAYGHVSGTLPGLISFDIEGDGVTDDYAQPITLGKYVSFDVTLSGQGVTYPICPVNTTGAFCSEIGYYLDFYDTSGNYLFSDDPDGFTGGVVVNLDTSTTPFVNSPSPGAAPDLTITPAMTAQTPEPSSVALTGTGIAAVLLCGFRRRGLGVEKSRPELTLA